MSALVDLSGEKEEENNYTDIDGTVDGTDNVMIASEHVCVDDRKSEGNREIKEKMMTTTMMMMGGEGEVLLVTTMPIW